MLALLDRELKRAGAVDVHLVQRPLEAAEAYRALKPDLVLLDLKLPPIDGFHVFQQFKEIDAAGAFVPVIMLTGDASEATKQKALNVGVTDFLSKDFELVELLLRARNALRTKVLYDELRRDKDDLEEMVQIRTRELSAAQREVLERLAVAAEFRDDQTAAHTRRVGHLAGEISRCLGQPKAYCAAIESAALLHDLGKIGISDSILLKKGPLSHDEFETMRDHTKIGGSILSGCTEPVMRMARDIAMTHHERWDGTGYPEGLAGERIPLEGRIVAVADSFDAMTTSRPYKEPIGFKAALDELQLFAGSQFDPKVVGAFIEAKLGEPVNSRAM